jgi:hypothetical protein
MKLIAFLCSLQQHAELHLIRAGAMIQVVAPLTVHVTAQVQLRQASFVCPYELHAKHARADISA